MLVASVAVVVSLPLAIAVAWLLAKRHFPGRLLVETLVNLPLVLPPVVTGYILLCVFGGRSTIGQFFDNTLGWRFVFDWKGAALASAVVAFPLLVRPIRLSFSSIDPRLMQAARTLGASRFDTFCSIVLPLSRSGILSGSLLAFARSVGEFGATILIAGNIAGQTQTIPLLIYSQLNSPGGIERSMRLVVASIIIAAAALLVGQWLDRASRARLEVAGKP
jgi:molybdate transport system permease protein